MDNWRHIILKEFMLDVVPLSLVFDPDGLLLEENILMEIKKQGFKFITFEDHIAFRYEYESQYRSRLDKGEKIDTSIILRIPSDDENSVPYDVLQAARKIYISLGHLFPNLSYPVIKTLDPSHLDALYEAYKKNKPEPLGENATKDFILHHVFEITPEIIKRPPDLLRVLLRRHYRNQRVPAIIDERFIQLLRQNNHFAHWALDDIIPNREAFFTFLQERWPGFVLSHISDKNKVPEDYKNVQYKYAGPEFLPFDHDDVRIYIDNLFLEGLLKPIKVSFPQPLSNEWISIGIISSTSDNREIRIRKLLQSVEKEIPGLQAKHTTWSLFAHKWAELLVLLWNANPAIQKKYQEQFGKLREKIDAVFQNWVIERYASLINLPALPPVMLHHLPRFLAYHLTQNDSSRVAILILDGLSLDQWITVRKNLEKQDSMLFFKEETVFAWIPTITSVSRQAIFAGKPPFYFPFSILTTNKEEAMWIQFWSDQGLNRDEVAYARGVGDSSLNEINEIVEKPRLRVLGLVIDKIDQIMHGMQLGSSGMHNQIRQWINEGFLYSLIKLLIEKGFSIYLSSDHGSIEAAGCGRPAEGSIADVRGERVRIFPNSSLLSRVKQSFPEAIEWPPMGLPQNYRVLIAPDRKAFVRKGSKVVCHGGITIEELIVPFIRIERKT